MEEDTAFIPTIFCSYCLDRTVAEIVNAKTHDDEDIQVVICVECNEAVNLIHNVNVRMYTPSEIMELGWDLFEVAAKLEEDRWTKIKPWAN